LSSSGTPAPPAEPRGRRWRLLQAERSDEDAQVVVDGGIVHRGRQLIHVVLGEGEAVIPGARRELHHQLRMVCLHLRDRPRGHEVSEMRVPGRVVLRVVAAPELQRRLGELLHGEVVDQLARPGTIVLGPRHGNRTSTLSRTTTPSTIRRAIPVRFALSQADPLETSRHHSDCERPPR